MDDGRLDEPWTEVMKQWFLALAPLAIGVVLAAAGRKRSEKGSGDRQRREKGLDGAIAALDEAQLRERFKALAPEFRLTHAGAGRPRWAEDVEINAFRSIGLVEWVKEPHIAAGRLDVCRLTEKGKRVQERLSRPRG